MTASELAAKIAEEVFRTIERENGIVKAQIAEAVERVLLKDGPHWGDRQAEIKPSGWVLHRAPIWDVGLS